MRDLSDIERQLREIKHMTNHYSNQIRCLTDKYESLKKQLLSRYGIGCASDTMRQSRSDTRKDLDDIETRIDTLEKEGVAFSRKACEWWPFLPTMVSLTNKAAEVRDRPALDNIFIKAVNALDMKVERQEVKEAGVVTVAKLKKDLRSALRVYKIQLKDVLTKRKRLKNPIGKRGPLKKTTLKQYQSIVKKWPEKQARLKAEIRKLNADIKALKSTKRLEFSNGMTLTVHRGGQYPVRMPKGPFAKVQKP